MKLYIELYLDEDVDVLLADLLRARGYNVLTTRDAGNPNATDEAQLAWAAEQGRAIMTHNRVDYEGLAKAYWESRRSHAGIVIAPQGSAYELLERLLPYWDDRTAEDVEGNVLYV